MLVIKAPTHLERIILDILILGIEDYVEAHQDNPDEQLNVEELEQLLPLLGPKS